MLPERLNAVMKQTKITVGQLATKAGIHRSYIYRLLNGERPNPSMAVLLKLAGALNVSPQRFYQPHKKPPKA